jgi:hypothetical protein
METHEQTGESRWGKAPRKGEYRAPFRVKIGTMRRLTCVAAAVAIAAFAACSGRPEEKTVTPVQTMAGTALPPIDRESHARLETATFAVG